MVENPSLEKITPLLLLCFSESLLCQAVVFYIDRLTPMSQETQPHIQLVESHHPIVLNILIRLKDYILTQMYILPSSERHHDQQSSPNSDWTIQLALYGETIPFTKSLKSMLQSHEVTSPLHYAYLVSYIFTLDPKTLCST